MQSVGRYLKVLACVVAIAVLSGCAFGTRQATLNYPPAPESGDQTVAQAGPATKPKSTTVFIAGFSDGRSDKGVVGTVRNGFGMRTADVVPTNSVSEWINKAVRVELQSSGYKVINGTPGDSANPNAVTVSGEILNVFCDMYMSYTGQVSLLIKATNSSGELLNGHYSGEGSAGLAWAATGESYAQSLALALEAAVKKFAADLETKLAGK